MTIVEDRLSRSLSPAAQGNPGAVAAGWADVEARVTARAHRRRTGQRVALAVAVVACTAVFGALLRLAAIADGSADSTTATSGPERVGILRGEPIVIAFLVVVGVLGIGLSALAVSRRQNAIRSFARRPHLLLVALGLALAPVWPAWVLLTYTTDVDASIERTVAVDGFDVVAIDRTWVPVDPGTELASVLVTVDQGASGPSDNISISDVETVLVDAGFERRDGSYFRDHGTGWTGWSETEQLTVVQDAGSRVTNTWTLDVRMPNAHSGELMPVAVLVLSMIVGFCALGLTLSSVGLGRRIGWFGMGLTAAQAALAVRALVRATALVDAHRSTVGPLDPNNIWQTPVSPAMRELHIAVEAVASGLYPVGSAALVVLTAPWLLNTAAALYPRRGPLIVVTMIWVLAAGATIVVFGEDARIMLNILE